MAIFQTGDRFLKWKYRVDEIYLLFPNEEPVQLPNERLVSLVITHDYENNVFPLFRIELVLEPSRYYKILANKDKMKFKLRIQKFYTEIGKRTESIFRDYINDTFDLILDDDDFDVDEGYKEEEIKNDYNRLKKDDVNDLYAVDNKMEFFLFKSDTIKASKKTVNKILKDATVLEAMTYIQSASGMKNVLMTPPHNQTVIPELVIPPLTAIGGILFVDCYYGLYKTGSMIYLDLDRNYIFPYNEKCSCWELNEKKETAIVIPKKNSAFSSDMCTVDKAAKDTKVNYVVGNNSTITVKNDSITYDVLAGNDIESIKLYDGEVTKGSSEAITKTENSERVIPNRTENPYFNDIYTQQSKARSIIINATFGDYDVAMLKPNTIYKFIFEDTKLTKKYKGNYRMVAANHVFAKDGRNFVVSTQAVFKCMTPNK